MRAAAVAIFRLLADVDPTSPLDWWGAASAAALIVAAASIVSRPPVRFASETHATLVARLAALVPTCVLAVVDASLGMTVVVHARNDPAELWLLAGPIVIAVLAYRAYASLRRRQAGLEFLYECSRILEGPATGEAMLIALMERAREMFHAETAEIIVDDGTGRPVRTMVGQSGALETLTPAPAECLSCLLALIPMDSGGILVHPGDPMWPSDSSAHGGVMDGVLVKLHGDGRVIGAISVAGRTDDGRFGQHDLRLLEALAGNVGVAIGTTQMIDELAASLADVSHLADLVSSSDDAIIAFTPQKVVTSWNAAAEALFGHAAAEVVGSRVAHLVPRERLPDLDAAFARACAGTQVRDLHVDARRRDGTPVPISATISPIRNADGHVTGISVIARNETERTLQESALRQSADRFQNVFEGSSVGMGVIGADLCWVRVNGALCRTLATSESALVGRRFEQRMDRDDIGSAHGLVSRLLRGESAGSTIEVRLRTPGDGRAVVAAFTVRPLRDGGSTMQALCMVEDVTERRLAEERARETESRLHRAVLDLTAVREPTAVIRATLRAARDVIDAESAALVVLDGDGEGPAVVVDDDVDPGGVGTVLRDYPGIAVTGAAAGPVRMPRVEGGVVTRMTALPSLAPLRSYLAVPIRFEGRLLATLHLGNRRHEEAFSEADVEVATVLAAQAAISLENARIHQRALALVEDLDQANTSLQQASETRSRLLASVSHELRTPLHSILVAAQLVRDSGLEQGGNRRVRGLGATIEGSGRHLLGLIDDFLDLSRIEVGAFELRPTPVLLGPLLREVRRDMAPLAAEKGIGLTIAEASGLLVVADPLRLRQVLLNLMSNALKFTPRGGRVRITVRLLDDGVRISVHDTGIGIAPGDLDRAFLPFEQVSGTDAPGVGLGLAISRRIAELHGGTLTAVSAVGRGSTFSVTLPNVASAELPIEIRAQVASQATPSPVLVAAR
jgi:PAS domain S-box-containing protein